MGLFQNLRRRLGGASRFTRARASGSMVHRGLAPRYHGRSARGGRLRQAILVLGGAAALGGLAFLANAAAELVSESQLFSVQRVKVRGTTYLTEETVLAHLGDVAGASLLDVRPGELAAQLCTHPRIRAARVSRGFDRCLLVEVEEREPIALVEAGMLVEVDAEGIVLPPVERAALPDLPVLTGGSGRLPAPGSEIAAPAIRDALRLVADVARTDPGFLAMVSEIDLRRSPLWRIHLVGRPQVIVAHARSLSAAKLAGLRTVLTDLDARGRSNVEVDLRFEGQLVVRELM
jgi:POTRA domain, FtsQ-type/Cell division protein FtsQ